MHLLKQIYFYLPNLFGLLPYSIKFRLTYRCNLKCIMCPIWRTDGWKPKITNELNNDEVKKLIKNILSSYKKVSYRPYVCISGGEPFLRDDILEISQLINGYNISGFCINSNGTLVTDEHIQGLKKCKKIHMNISVLGPEEIHDKISGKIGAFKKTIETIRKLKEDKLSVTIQTTITSLNYMHLIDIFDIAEKYSCSLYYNFGQFATSENYNKQKEITKREFKEEFFNTSSIASDIFKVDHHILKKQITLIKEKNKTSNVFYRFIPNIAFEEIKEYYYNVNYRVADKCYYFLSGLTITPSGSLTPCVFNYEICDLKNISFKEALNHKRFKKIRKYIKSKGLFPICNHCGYLIKN